MNRLTVITVIHHQRHNRRTDIIRWRYPRS